MVVALSVLNAVVPQRNGWLALTEVGAPFLFATLLPFNVPAVLRMPAAPTRPRRWRAVLRLSLAVALAVAAVRFGPVWFSFPPASAGATLAPAGTVTGAPFGVTSWNLESGEADPTAVVNELRAAPVGIVGLEEFSPRDAEPIRSDAASHARFPYQLLFPRDGSLGMGLLSSFPILQNGRIADDPPVVWAQLDLGSGRTLHVVIAHPLPGDIPTLGPLPIPVDYVTTTRDAQIRTLRLSVDGLLSDGQPLILAGDFNVTDREPAYADLAHGLLDAHLEVGLGPGSTWRPDEIKWLPFGVLRIDMAFGGNGARPLSMTADCTPHGSDHCLIQASMALP